MASYRYSEAEMSRHYTDHTVNGGKSMRMWSDPPAWAEWKCITRMHYAPGVYDDGRIENVRAIRERRDSDTVPPEWMDRETGYHRFLADVGKPPTDAHDLWKIDPDGPWSADNCEWVDCTPPDPRLMAITAIYLEIDGRRQSMADWCREVGTNYETAKKRHDRGWGDREVVFGK